MDNVAVLLGMTAFTLWMPNDRGYLPCASLALKFKKIVITWDAVWYQVITHAKKYYIVPPNGKNTTIVVLENISGSTRTHCQHIR